MSDATPQTLSRLAVQSVPCLPTVDKVLSLVRGYAQQCLTDLRGIGEHPRPEAALLTGEGWGVLLTAFPLGPGEPDLSQPERDCLTLLAQAQGPLTGGKIMGMLEARGILWGAVTIKRALARLVKRRLVNNSRGRPRGYYLPEALPLLRQISRPPE